MNKILILLLGSLLFSGCSIATYYLQEGAKEKKPIDPKNVRIYSATALKSKYEVLGSIAVDKMGDGDSALELLREKAASIGANAVIDARLVKLNTTANRTGISGVAVYVQ